MSIRNPKRNVTHEEWGDGRVVSHWDEGGWIMYDPESDAVDVSEWR